MRQAPSPRRRLPLLLRLERPTSNVTMPAVKTCAVINQKGGVGKTTTVANLGAALAASGRKVCVMDLDPQAHLTLHLGVEPTDSLQSMYDVLTGSLQLPQVHRQLSENLWLAPAVIDLAAAEMELAGTVGREQILRDQLSTHQLPYDLVLIDCPPSLGLLTLNALAAADEVLIPLQPHFLALQGMGKLLETVSLVQRRINPRLRVGGVLLCMFESTTRLAGEVVRDLQGFFQAARGGPSPWSTAHLFSTFIRRNIKLAESPSYGKTIFDYEPSSNGATDYRELAREFLEHFDGAAPTTTPAATRAVAEVQVIEQNAPAPVAEAKVDHQRSTTPTAVDRDGGTQPAEPAPAASQAIEPSPSESPATGAAPQGQFAADAPEPVCAQVPEAAVPVAPAIVPTQPSAQPAP